MIERLSIRAERERDPRGGDIDLFHECAQPRSALGIQVPAHTVVLLRKRPRVSGSPRNFFAITQELTGEILRCLAREPYNGVSAFLH